MQERFSLKETQEMMMNYDVWPFMKPWAGQGWGAVFMIDIIETVDDLWTEAVNYVTVLYQY